MTNPVFINAGIFHYRDHYIIYVTRGNTRAWDVVPDPESNGLELRKVKSRADAIRKIDIFFKDKKQVRTLF